MKTKIELLKLQNRLPVLLVERPESHIAFMALWVRTGTAWEEKNEYGLAHFFEHILFKGTKKFPTAKELASTIENLGGYMNAETSYLYTHFHLNLYWEHIEKGLEVLSEMVLNPLLASSEIEKEKRVVLEELHQYQDDPQSWIHTLFYWALWGKNSAYGREILGTEKSIMGFSREKIVRFWKKYYHPANSLLVIGGRFKKKEIEKLTQKYFGKWKTKGKIADYNFKAKGFRRVVWEKREKIQQTSTIIGWPFVEKLSEKEKIQAGLFSLALGSGQSSPLFQNLREKNALCYSVWAREAIYPTAWMISLGSYLKGDPASFKKALSLVKESIGELTDRKKAREHLERARNTQLKNLSLLEESTPALSTVFGRYYLQYRKLYDIEKRRRYYFQITPYKIQKIAKKLLTEKPAVAVIAPWSKPRNFSLRW